MALYWGVRPIFFDSGENHDFEIESSLKVVQARLKINNGTRAVVTGGRSTKTPGSTSILEVREMNYL
jgi:pyruvate kinase